MWIELRRLLQIMYHSFTFSLKNSVLTVEPINNLSDHQSSYQEIQTNVETQRELGQSRRDFEIINRDSLNYYFIIIASRQKGLDVITIL